MIVTLEKCITCERCLDECPLQAISIENGRLNISEECTNCRACLRICPVDALVFEEKPLEGTIECHACPIHCQIRPNKVGACGRFVNSDGDLVRNIPLHNFYDVEEIVGTEHESFIRKPLITAIGAGTTRPDFKPAPYIVRSEVDGVDVVTVVSEAPLSYSGMLIKIDSDEYIGEECASVFVDKAAKAPCKEACPVGVDVPHYVRLITEGKFAEALAVVREKNPFPGVCGYVCSHPCESECERNQLGGAIAIRALKRFVSDCDNGLWRARLKIAEPTGKHVVIVGSGPAGLTAAYYLARIGHRVVIFEALPVAGGMMRVGIPQFRLPRDVSNKEIEEIKGVGVEIKANAKVESLDKLLTQGYDAVLLAIGAHQGQILGLPGVDLDGVLVSTAFLGEVSLGKGVEIGDRVVVLGGGNVAFDCARTALRLGASDVHIACVEPRDGMLATAQEIKWAEEEGITIHNSKRFTRIVGDKRKVGGVEFLHVKSFEFSEEGELHVNTTAGSEHVLQADTVIFAIAQFPDPKLLEGVRGIEIDRRHTINVDPATLGTGREGVFAAGDVVTGVASVIEAIADGRKAAISIDKYLGGKGIIDEKLASPESIPMPSEVLKPKEEKRIQIPSLAISERLNNFATVEEGYTEEMAIMEAKRCLRCDLEKQVRVGHMTTEQYGSKMLSIGGPALVTKKGGSTIVRLMVDIANQKGVSLKVDGGDSLRLQVGKAPIINGRVKQKMRVLCGSACAGLFAAQFLKAADEVIVIDPHITSLFTKHEAGSALNARYSGVTLRGIETSPGRYVNVTEVGSGWGGTCLEDPLEVIDSIDMNVAWPGMRILIIESTGENAGMYELDKQEKLHQINLTPDAQTAVDMISRNSEPAKVSAMFLTACGGATRGGATKLPLKLTEAIHKNKAKLTVGGAPVFILPGGGINFLVDVSKIKVHAFTWVPSPAPVFPIEYTMHLEDYLEIGGHKEAIRRLEEIEWYFRQKRE